MIGEQTRGLEEQAAAIEELRADVLALAAEVRELRHRLGRDSGNSSMGPAADDMPGRTPPPAKPKLRKGGRQPASSQAPGFVPGVVRQPGRLGAALPAGVHAGAARTWPPRLIWARPPAIRS